MNTARQVNDKNQIWYESSEGMIKIGFTRSFLDQLDECWHILPSHLERFKQKAPLLTVETNDSLISIMSPVAGNFMHYSEKAQNFPDKLLETDVIMELSTGTIARPQQQAAIAQPPRAARFDGQFANVVAGRNLFEGVVPEPPRMARHQVVMDEIAQRAAAMRNAVPVRGR